MRIIALCGAQGAGKTTVAKILVEKHGFTRLRFADPLKRMLRALDLSEAQVDGDLKNAKSLLLCGKTPVHAMQTLGTEWGRNCIHPDLWIAHFERSLTAYDDNGVRNIVCDDMRFPNEYEQLKQLGAEIWRVDGRSYSDGRDQHESEAYWKSFVPTLTLPNDLRLEDLYARVEWALSQKG